MSEGAGAQGQGSAYGCDLVLGADAQEPGDKRREIPLERSQEILRILADLKDGDEFERQVVSGAVEKVERGLYRLASADILDLTLADRRLACLQVEERMRLQAASGTTSKCGDQCSLPSRRLPYAYDVYILAHEG